MWALFIEANMAGQKSENIRHPFPPVLGEHAAALVLGSFPSVRSRENAFYYGHPQNRFWKVLAALFQADVPDTIGEKTAFLHQRRIALWDVVSVCDITGSADSALTPLQMNDVAALVLGTGIRHVFLNGQKAGALYRISLERQVGLPYRILPSTSPANAMWTLQRLIAAWIPLREAVEIDASRTR
jgi:double-stranded uracil-DNA glycosylase